MPEPRIVGRYELHQDLAAGRMGTACLVRLRGRLGGPVYDVVRTLH